MKKWAALLLIAALLLVSACGNGNSGNTGNTGSTGNAGGGNQEQPAGTPGAGEETPKEEPVKLTFWVYPRWSGITGDEQGGQLGDYERDAAKRFTELYPHVTINVEMLDFNNGPQKVNVALASGEQPDVIEDSSTRLMGYANLGHLEALDGHLDQAYVDRIIPSVWQQTTIGDGNHYFIPWGVAPSGMLINKTLVDQAGLGHLLPSNEERTWTIDEYKTLIAGVTEKTGIPGVGLYAGSESGSYFLMNHIWSAGALDYNEQKDAIALNTPEGVAGLAMMKSFIDEGLANEGAAGMKISDTLNLFYDQKLVSISAAPIHYSRAKAAIRDQKSAPYDMYFTAMPQFPGQPITSADTTFGFAVFKTKDPNRVKWAVEFAKFMGDKDNATPVKASNSFTAYDDLNADLFAADNDPNLDVAAKLVKYGVDQGWAAPGYDDVRKMYIAEFQKVFLGRQTPEEAMRVIEEEGNKIIAKFKGVIAAQQGK